jgi:hypothetical protein
MRLLGTKLAANSSHRGFGDQLYDLSGVRPSLDLNFSANKSLIDSASGQNLVTFTRASSGTFVGSDGVLRSAVTNLLLRSEEFGTTWDANNITVSADTTETTAPNGTVTADKITGSSAASNIKRISQSVTLSAIPYAFSVYAKASNQNFLQIRTFTDFGNIYANFDIATGVVGTTLGVTSASVVAVGSGWYRCQVVFTPAAATSSLSLNFITALTSSSLQNTTLTTSLYLWGAQLEQSATVGEYIPTTSTINSAPRFDHNPTTGESLGLLVEEQSRNLLLQSEDFSTTWGLSTATVSTNVDTAPNGLLTADKLIVNNGASNGYAAQSNSYTSGTTYTFSVYAKAAGATDFRIVLLATSFGSSSTAQFNLSNGTVTSFGGAWSSAAISSVGNGWYRVFGVATATATASSASRFQCTTTGDGSIGVLLWGAQLEAAAFPTSYIPTTTAAVTRSADVASITGARFSSWYRQDEGTYYGSFLTPYVAPATVGQALFSVNDGTANNRNFLSKRANADVSTRWSNNKTGGTDTAFINIGTWAATPLQAAVTYKENDYAGSLSGAAVGTDATVNLATNLNIIELGANLSSSYLNGTIKRLTYWPTRLSNSTLQEITQQ